MSDLTDRLDALKKGGFSQDEIDQWISERRASLATAGFSKPEIDQAFNIPEPNIDASPVILGQRIGGIQGAGRRAEGGCRASTDRGQAKAGRAEPCEPVRDRA